MLPYPNLIEKCISRWETFQLGVLECALVTKLSMAKIFRNCGLNGSMRLLIISVKITLDDIIYRDFYEESKQTNYSWINIRKLKFLDYRGGDVCLSETRKVTQEKALKISQIFENKVLHNFLRLFLSFSLLL